MEDNMKVFTGKELFDSFTELDRSLRNLKLMSDGLKLMSDGKFHLTAQFRTKTFEFSGEPKEVLEQFAAWVNETFGSQEAST